MIAASLGLASLVSVASAACSFGPGTTGELSLQQVTDNLLVGNSVNTATDCLGDNIDSYWKTSGSSAATLIVEIAGFSNSNTFGIYDLNNPNNMIEVFGGSASSGANAQIDFTNTGSGYDVTITQGSNSTTSAMSTDTFGFYITTPQSYTFFSDTSLNTADNTDHLFTYQGNGDTFDTSGSVPLGLQGTVFSPDKFLLAWEDLINGGDGDYQDMVVLGEFIFPVPVPAAFWLLVSALPFFGFTAKRRN
jgi:hypothetical protein